MHDIFLSYAREDQLRVRPLAEALEAQGWSIWWDVTIPAGKSFSRVIQKALSEARCIIVVWSRSAIASDWVLSEANEGREREILVPVQIDKVKPPMPFNILETDDLSEWDGSRMSSRFRKVVLDVEIILGRSPIEAMRDASSREEEYLPERYTIKVATFNVENLFARFQFRRNIRNLDGILRDGWAVNHTYFSIYNEREKAIKGATLRILDVDVIALQEVENLDALRKFRTDYLGGRKSYPYALAIDGNDPRGINVAILSRYPLTNIQTHNHLWSLELRSYLFSRDCLVADVQGPGNLTFTLFVNHFKSMIERDDPDNGRRNTRERRIVQARAVKQVVTARFGTNAGIRPFIILGDFNDYMESDDQGEPGIGELIQWDQVVNVVDRLPEDERWTYCFNGRGALEPTYHQLDYLLLSKSLAQHNPQPPYIERRGLPQRASRYDGERFVGIGLNSPKASDHCPLMMELTV